MLETAFAKKTSNSINKMQLVKLRLKAIRAGVWFKALHRIDRVLVNLTIKVARCNVRSTTLAKNIRMVMEKLEGLLEGRLSKVVRKIGKPLAQKLSAMAQKWGNHSAKDWLSDISFARFLAVLSINKTCNL
jgi:hypothetical protein